MILNQFNCQADTAADPHHKNWVQFPFAKRYKSCRKKNQAAPLEHPENGNVNAVMDGDIDLFISAYLKWISLKNQKTEEA